MFCAALARGRPCCACDNIQLKHMGQNNNTTTYRTHIKHDLSCGVLGLGFAGLRDKVQGYSTVFRCL